MISQQIFIPATNIEVYNALMDEKIHSEFTGAEAHIKNEIGSTFSVWDGYATGENLVLVPGKEIIQSWRASDWPKAITSKVKYLFHEVPHGCEIEFEHSNVPDQYEKDIENGWYEFYWKPLKQYFRKEQS